MPGVIEALRAALGADKVHVDEVTRKERRHDYWLLSQLDDAQERAAPMPLCVVRPVFVTDVALVIDVCRKTRTPLVPYGLGSGVCGGVLVTDETVVIDLGDMRRVREIDEENLIASFDAGIRGSDAEAALREKNLTLGHFPQSVDISTVGGWVATRASGQFSTGYGNIEDLILDLEVVLPSGRVLSTKRTPRSSTGPDLRHVFLGSEGTLGVITGVTFSVRRTPERRAHSAYHVSGMREGLELQRRIVQEGWQPAVMRQYDATEAERHFGNHARAGHGLLLLVHDGPASRVDAEVQAVAEAASRAGADAAPEQVVPEWLERRNHVPSFRMIIDAGAVVDTIEIASTWDKAHAIYAAAVESLRGVEGLLTASAHSSHVYRSGVNLYFTFAAQPSSRDQMKATYLECWRRVLSATVDGGGSIAHHHGIGRIRKEWLERELGPTGVSLLRTLKYALDPEGFMNPGVLLPG